MSHIMYIFHGRYHVVFHLRTPIIHASFTLRCKAYADNQILLNTCNVQIKNKMCGDSFYSAYNSALLHAWTLVRGLDFGRLVSCEDHIWDDLKSLKLASK